MNLNKNFAKQVGIFLLFVIGFWAISALYLSPAIGGEKVLRQGDMQQVRLMRAEMDSVKAKTGEFPGWTDGMFSGMPTSLITGIQSGNLVHKSGVVQIFNMVQAPFSFLFVAMLSMFVLLLSAQVNRWLAAAGGIGYAFMTFSITSYEAGHITKVLAMAAMPGIIAGLILMARKSYLLGFAVLGLFFTVTVGYFHYQIAYYAGIMAGVFIAAELVRALIAKDAKHALIMGGLAVAGLAFGVLSNVGKIVDTEQYSRATMRGGSEVATGEKTPGTTKQTARKGLDKEYAFAWSYSPKESFTLLVPRFVGGSSGEKVGPNEINPESEQLPMYTGDLDFTSGPVYIGAVFMALFVMGFVIVVLLSKTDKDSYKLARGIALFSLLTTLISLFLAFGRFFSLNDVLFDILPYYNKFRTPMMALAIAQVTIPFFGLYALQLLFSYSGKDQEVIKKIMKTSFIAVGVLFGITMLVLMSSDFVSSQDPQLKQNNWPIEQLRDFRSSKAWSDLFRSIAFAGIAIGLIWLVMVKKQKQMIAWVGILILVSVDMIGISKRYLSDDNWEYKELEETVTPTAKDLEISKKNKDQARVFDFRYNPFNDAHSAPWHRGIGGYHPAKLSRYQDLISTCIAPTGGYADTLNNALDMLNCRYLLTFADRNDPRTEAYLERPTALGNAWFVNEVIIAPDAKTALQSVNIFKPADQAIVEKKDAETSAGLETRYTRDSSASIAMKKYSLDTITYAVSNSNKGLAVFSEIYYNESNGSWKCLADGKELPILRVNYTLRGAVLPAGTKEVVLYYNKKGNRYVPVEMGASGLLLALLGFVVVSGLLKKEENPE